MPDLEYWLEAEKRGILPADMRDALAEARKRGLIQAAPQAEGQSQEKPSVATDVWNTVPSALARGAAAAIGLPGTIGHGMRWATDQVRQSLGYKGNPDYVAGTGQFSNPLDIEPKDVTNALVKVTGPLYEPKTTLGRYVNAVGEFVGANALPGAGVIGRTGNALAVAAPAVINTGQYVRNALASSVGGGVAQEGAGDLGAPGWLQGAAALVGGVATHPDAWNSLLSPGRVDPRAIEKTAAARAAQEEGLTVPRAAVDDSILKPVAGRIASLPIVGAPLQNTARESLDQIGNRVQEIGAAYGAGSRPTAGGELGDAITKYVTKGSRDPVGRAYAAVDNLVPPNVSIQPSATMAAVKQLERASSEAEKAVNAKAISTIQADLDKGHLSYQEIKSLRTIVGSLLNNKLSPDAATLEPAYKKLYGALTDDMKDSIGVAGGQPALDAWEKANRLHQVASERREQLAKIVGATGDASDEQVFERIITLASNKGQGGNIERLTMARKAAGSEAWDDLTSAFIGRIGKDPKTGQFSPDRFLTALGNDKISPEGRQILFNSTGKGDLARSIENLRKVSEQFSELYRMGNPSGTAGATFVTSLFGFGSIGGLLNPLAAAGSGASLGGMYLTAKFFSRPANVDKMTRTLQARIAYAKNPTPSNRATLAQEASVLANLFSQQDQR